MKTMKKCFVLLLTVLLITAMCLSAAAEWESDVLLDNCDVNRWAGTHTGSTNTSEQQEGKGCAQWTVPAGQDAFVMMARYSTPINAEGANTLVMDVYLSSADTFCSASSSEFEMTSSGECDVQETGWDLTNYDLVDGWNHLELPISPSGGCDLTRINYLRWFALSMTVEETLVVRVDNIYLTYIEPEDESKITEGHTIGNVDKNSATPVMKDVVVNGPYDPWTEVEETASARYDLSFTFDAWFGVSAAWVGGIGLSAMIACLRKYRKVLALLAVIALLLAGCGSQAPSETPSDNPAGDPSSPEQPGDDPDEPGDQPSVSTNPFFTTDQTGHPEVSADSVDVEALLTINPSYSTKKDYTIHFVSSEPVKDFSKLPHVMLHENSADEKGLSMSINNGNQPEFFHLLDRDCWMLQYWDKTNQFQIQMDEATVAQYSGKSFSLNFIVYVTSSMQLVAKYTDTNGNVCTAEATCGRYKMWATVSVTLENVDFSSPISFEAKGPDITRVHAVYVSDPPKAADIQTGVVDTRFETDSYIVADANVRAFGALGNGYTDDTEAFQAAIDYVSSLGGGTVYVPVGYYCLTKTLNLPIGVGLVGDLEQGTAHGTVLCVYGGKGEIDASKAAVLMDHQSAVMNIAFWYPEQTFVNGQPIPYPPTLVQNGSESVTIRNVTLVNSYFGIHFGKNGNNSLQYVRDVYGTCLSTGYYNNNSYDIGRVEGVTFTPDIWLASGLPGTPNAELLRTYMIRNSVGMLLQRIDWTYLADITIEGYSIGVLCNASETGTSNGHIYNLNLLDCYYGLYSEQLNWLMITNSTFRCVGGDGATPVYVADECEGKISLSFCQLTTTGANALLNWGKTEVAVMDCILTSATSSTYVNLRDKNDILINTTLSGNAEHNRLMELNETPKLLTTVDYGKTVVTKPASDALVHLGQEPYSIKKGEDITDKLQAAIDSLKTTGGTVYIPAGSYVISDYIDVWAGIELRGAVAWPQNMNKTELRTEVGKNDPDGRAVFTLYDGSGMRGLSVTYSAQNHVDLDPYSYTIRGKGKGIYLVAISLPTSWRGVDFASHRCDNHYIEYLWMAPLDTGIAVGAGSENGIIRDCHFTPNTWCARTNDRWWDDVYNEIMARSRPYVIGESVNEILYHNFTYGAREGVSITDGAENVYLLCHGVDSGYTSAKFSGDCSVTMVDCQLVNLHKNNGNADMHYVETSMDFEGKVTMIQTAFWGTTKGAFVLDGDGDIVMYGVQMHSAGTPMCRLLGGTLELYGMLETTRTKDFYIGDFAVSLTISGNIFPGGLQIEQSDNAEAEITGSDLQEWQ